MKTNRNTICLALVAVLLVTVTVTGNTAEAQGPKYDPERALALLHELAAAEDPTAALVALSPEDRELVMWASIPVSEGTRTYTEDYSGDSDDMPACKRHVREKYKTNPLGIRYLTYESYTWWCRLDGEIHGTPEFSAWGSVHTLFKVTWEFGGNDYTSDSMASDRSWHSDEAQGHFNNCVPARIPLCVRGWTVQINKKHFGNGSQTSW